MTRLQQYLDFLAVLAPVAALMAIAAVIILTVASQGCAYADPVQPEHKWWLDRKTSWPDDNYRVEGGK